eukprot:evm.model.scf_2245.4 EVM.evm.TU.scf_2245.4   scf_2245:18942-22883(+)
MASVSNSFDLLGSGAASLAGEGKKRNRKRNKAKQQDAQAAGAPTDAAVQPQAARIPSRESAPSAAELEAAGSRACSREERLELWNTWATDAAQNARLADANGRMVSFRDALLASRGLEVSVEACLDAGVDADLESGIASLLDAVLTATDPDTVRAMVAAVAHLAASLASASPEVVLAAKGAVCNVITALKKADALAQRPQKRAWQGSGKGGQGDRGKGGGRPVANRQGSELKDAADGLRKEQEALDAYCNEVASVGGEAREVNEAASRTIADFRAVVAMSGQAAAKPNGKKQKGKGKGAAGSNSHASPVLEPLQREQAALETKAASLAAEIASMEARLASLKSQLAAVNETKSHLVHRKNAITGSLQSSAVAPQSAASQEEQLDAARWLEGVLSQIQGRGLLSGQEGSIVTSYLEASQKLLQACISKQDDLMKNAKFLKECIERKYATERNLAAMGPTVDSKLIQENRSQREALEHQLQGILKEAGTVASHAEKALDGIRSRADFLESMGGLSKELEIMAARVLRRHRDIQAEIWRKPQQATPSPPPPTKKKFDASAIVRQAEGEFAQSLQYSGQRNQQSQRSTAPPAKKKFDASAIVKQAEGEFAQSLQHSSQRNHQGHRSPSQQQQPTLNGASPQPSAAPIGPNHAKLATNAPRSQPRQLNDSRVQTGGQHHHGMSVDASVPVSHVPQMLVDPQQVQPGAHTYHAIAPLQKQPAPAAVCPRIPSMDAVTAEPIPQHRAMDPEGFNRAISAPRPNDLLKDAYQSQVGLGLTDGLHQSDYAIPMPTPSMGQQPQYISQVTPLGMDVSTDPSRVRASSSSRRGWRPINSMSPIEIGTSTSPTPAEARDKGLIGREKIAKKGDA